MSIMSMDVMMDMILAAMTAILMVMMMNTLIDAQMIVHTITILMVMMMNTIIDTQIIVHTITILQPIRQMATIMRLHLLHHIVMTTRIATMNMTTWWKVVGI